MKLKNALLVSLAFVLSLGSITHLMAAAAAVRSPKPHTCNIYSTSAKVIATGPGALYSVNLSTGGSGEFVIAYDTGSSVGIGISSATSATLFPPLYYGGAAANSGAIAATVVSSNTMVVFDPPLQFFAGLTVFDQASTGISCYTWEPGRELTGQ